MKKFIFIILLFLVTGCFFDKSEKLLINCADSSYSKTLVDNFNRKFYIDDISISLWTNGTFTPTDILSQKIIKLNEEGYSINKIVLWLQELKTSQVNNSNKDYINYLIKEKNKSNEKQDYLLKLKITDKLKDNIYEREFKNCEKQRNEDTKTFDLKWEKPKFYRVEFR